MKNENGNIQNMEEMVELPDSGSAQMRDAALETILSKLGSGWAASAYDGAKAYGIAVIREGDSIGCTYYPNKDDTAESYASHILEDVNGSGYAKRLGGKSGFRLDSFTILHNVYPVLVSTEKNRALLDSGDVPYREYLPGISICYNILGYKDAGEISVVSLKADMLRDLCPDLTPQGLYETAIKNLPNLFEVNYGNYSSFISLDGKLRKNHVGDFFEHGVISHEMGILSNKELLNGSSMILLPGLLDEICRKTDAVGLVLFPVSVHEWMFSCRRDGKPEGECRDVFVDALLTRNSNLSSDARLCKDTLCNSVFWFEPGMEKPEIL